ncbi:MAG: hypothetical protein JXQ83_05620, partial [Candidatus Glassbacteria bacterium]|nr:hypothetical protein [Candidatus Glassbacteria bacterium]
MIKERKFLSRFLPVLLSVFLALPLFAQDEVIFEDDFEDGVADGWTPLHAENWEVAEDFGDNSLAIVPVSFEFGLGYSLGEYIILDDLELDFNFRITVWARHARSGLEVMESYKDFAVIFNYFSEDHYYYVGVNSTGDPRDTDGILEFSPLSPRTDLNPAAEAVYRYDPPYLEAGPGQDVVSEEYQEVVIERRGQQIIVYLDEMEIYNAVIPDLPWGGKLGLGSQNDKVMFDDIKVESISVEQDVVPPSAISDLTLVEVADYKTATITWTAVGDDGSEGTAFSYDVRYGTEEINAGNFAQATAATGVPTPEEAGSTETLTLTNLKGGLTYYLAIVVSDEQMNESALSNVVTLETPEKDYKTITADDFSARTITLDGDLSDWDLESANKVEYGESAVAAGAVVLGPSVDSTLGDADFKADLYMAWDYDGIYIAVDATDDIYLTPEFPRSAYEGDGIEVYFDWDGDYDNADSSVVHFGLTPEGGQLYKGGPSSDPNATTGFGSWYSDLSTAGIEYGATPGSETSGNWTLEVFIPWGMNGRGIEWDRRIQIGINVKLADRDGNDADGGPINT